MEKIHLSTRLYELEDSMPDTYWTKRAFEEMSYLLELERCGWLDMLEGAEKHGIRENTEVEETGGLLSATDLLEQGLTILETDSRKFQTITKAAVSQLEETLAPLSVKAKKLRVLCCGNAHIDMNWMWGYQETASVTVDTIRTVLAFMDEYPQMTYTQSQASVYEILEKYAPDTLPQIRRLVREGRWEASVSTWVENEKNMGSLEAMTRHLLYAKTYISKLLGIPLENLDLDLEPDTFGHPCNLPEILKKGGVRYYYHCRGHEGPNLFRWQAPSGAQVLAFREPNWYNLSIDYGMCRHVPQFCREYGVETVLHMYGVGDHGGGPTRRDLNRLCDMAKWPLFPKIEFGTVRQFFREVEAKADMFPVVDQELNYVFTGCYTSQGRIKRANRMAEDKLCQMEALEVMARAWVKDYQPSLEKEQAWRHVLFNQFHDILPGSGTVETREYAMGIFQSAMACVQTGSVRALRALGGIDNAPLAGVGSMTADRDCFEPSQAGVEGDQCSFLMVNTSAQKRSELVSLTIWDWQRKADQLRVMDVEGNVLPHQLEETGVLYWGHTYQKLLVKAVLPSMGYGVCHVVYEPPQHVLVPVNQEPRKDTFGNGKLVLENNKIRAVFLRETMECTELIHKASGQSFLEAGGGACAFYLDMEDPIYEMTAWRIGPRMKTVNLNRSQSVHISRISLKPGTLRQEIVYHLEFSRSRLEVSIGLDEDCEQLDFSVKADWLELGDPSGVPLLRFVIPYAYKALKFRYLTAGGVVERSPEDHDVPSRGLVCAVNNSDGLSLALLCDCKYGFFGDEDQIGVSVLRSPFDPDPYPDQGTHYLKIEVAVTESGASALEALADKMSNPILTGVLSAEQAKQFSEKSLVSVCGANCQAMKLTEDGCGFLLRLINPYAWQQETEIVFQIAVKEAYLTDIMEKERRPVFAVGNTVRWKMEPSSLDSLVIIPETWIC